MKDFWIKGGAVARWQISAVESRVYPGVARTMPDTVTYRFENGWVDTGDLPCREALRKDIAEREVDLSEIDFHSIYIAGPMGDVDFSDFCHLPEWRVRHAQVTLHVAKAQTVWLDLETAGGVHLWCDDAFVHRFEPFTRNEVQSSLFSLSLSKGAHTLTARFEDLHERDTRFGFRLRLIKGDGLLTETDSDADPLELNQAVALLERLRTVDVFHSTSTVQITSDALPDRQVMLTCVNHDGQSGVLSQSVPHFAVEAPAGCTVLRFTVDVGGVQLSRTLGVTVMADPHRCTARNISGFLARQDSGTDIAATLLALAQDRYDAAAAERLYDALMRVEARYDCADFRMMGLLWIWDRYRNRLPADAKGRLERAVLGFRYWMDEPGNDVMWFWSENHVLCFHIAQHLAGGFFPDATFTASGRTGTEQASLGAERLHKWFDAIEDHGLAEWNSAAYYPINYRGLLTLYTLTQDVALKQRAQNVLDQISRMVAVHMCGGVPTGSQGRMYEKELLAGPMTELGAIGAIMCGGWHVPGKDAAAVMLALSDYRPPEGLETLAAPQPGTRLRARYQQGLDGQARLSLYKTAHVQLSTVNHHQPHQKGHQQHVLDLQFTSDPLARVWINHPGTMRHWAEARPSFWAGNGRLPDVSQADETALMLYRIDASDIPFSHLFLPRDRLDDYLIEDHWAFLRSGEGYAAIWSAGQLKITQGGLYKDHEVRQQGPLCGWMVHVGDAVGYRDFATFQQNARALAPQLSGARLTGGQQVLDANAPCQKHEPLPRVPYIETATGPNGDWAPLQDKN